MKSLDPSTDTQETAVVNPPIDLREVEDAVIELARGLFFTCSKETATYAEKHERFFVAVSLNCNKELRLEAATTKDTLLGKIEDGKIIRRKSPFLTDILGREAFLRSMNYTPVKEFCDRVVKLTEWARVAQEIVNGEREASKESPAIVEIPRGTAQMFLENGRIIVKPQGLGTRTPLDSSIDPRKFDLEIFLSSAAKVDLPFYAPAGGNFSSCSGSTTG